MAKHARLRTVVKNDFLVMEQGSRIQQFEDIRDAFEYIEEEGFKLVSVLPGGRTGEFWFIRE